MPKRHVRWLLFVCAVKLIQFVYFAYELNKNHGDGEIINGIFASVGDTEGYYTPIEAIYNDLEYKRVDRMPGLIPIYLPLLYLFDQNTSKAIIIVLQFFMHILSIYACGLIAISVFKSDLIFKIVILLYTISTFTSTHDHYGSSDSIHLSALLFSVYLFLMYLEKNQLRYILFSGLFLTWSVFMRQIAIVTLPAFGIYLLSRSIAERRPVFSSTLIPTALLIIPLFLSLSLWTYRNYNIYDEFIPLVKMDYFGEEIISTRNFIIANGEDIVDFSNYTMGDWFYFDRHNGTFQLEKNLCYTSAYNADSVLLLKTLCMKSMNKNLPYSERQTYAGIVTEKAIRYTNSIRNEAPFRYYVVSPLKLVLKFLFPGKIHNFPFPSREHMNYLQFSIKAFYLVFFHLINFAAVAGIMICLIRRHAAGILLSLFPFSILFTLTYILGYIEQRYFVPIYPFMTIFAAYPLGIGTEKIRRRYLTITGS